MTDTKAASITFDAIGPGPEYRSTSIWLPQLFLETRRAGSANIENRTFIECLIEGPAVLLPLSGCNFDSCDMGDAQGDPRTLMLKPVGPDRVIGTIAIRNCKFIRCRFLGVGFTGPQSFLDGMITGLGGAAE
jgi:hypothetical protein